MPFDTLTEPRLFIQLRCQHNYITITSLLLMRPRPPGQGKPERREPVARNCCWIEEWQPSTSPAPRLWVT